MVDVFGTASAALGLFDQSIRIFNRARAAANVKELQELFDTHSTEVQETKAWVDMVTTDDSLETPAIQPAISKIKRIAEKLHTHLSEMVGEGRNGVQQFVHQFASGPSERALLKSIVLEVNHAKVDLLLRVQLVLLGINKNIEKAMNVSIADIKEMKEKLGSRTDTGSYPKLEELLDKLQPNDDGTVTVARADLEGLLNKAGVELQPAELEDGRRAKKDISDNDISETAFAITGPIGPTELDPWGKADVAIKNNNIRGYAIIHAQHSIEPLQILARTKVQVAQAKGGYGGNLYAQPQAESGGEPMDTE